ncbi:DeoR/GlpR family DNA-binding transcription regulator [Paraflavitalea sp. CAU 1676]|uniref:DeoR/GlpR family DNA-binding transcription regulator n=1 Tax=Paraflavitalea sp. CAU 1676 TaxID=3032598 RepID=UPI0023DA015E|nr:DeoR/GlpR family DNA-binding transcription regulator [Paraflavitalea sp. CAU 1676]MDF2193581.1 DeoR/GlpR family DNA-binding transcription regulator [Paraflavitalea sp. CAU 1676]
MFKKERQAYILKEITEHQKVISADISQKMNVSEDTIRRDLQELANKGKLLKVHGGALSLTYTEAVTPGPGEETTHPETQQTLPEKIIAQKAAQLIHRGMFVMTSGGTTASQLARTLPEDLKATIISGSIQAIVEFTRHPSIEVIIIGDKVSKNGKLTVGSEAIAKIKQIKADICLLDIQAIDVQYGLSEADWEIAQIKKAMIENSQKVIGLCRAERINQVRPVQLCPITALDTLITEQDPAQELFRPYAAAGLGIL